MFKSHPQSPGGVADRLPDGRGHLRDLRRGGAPLPVRACPYVQDFVDQDQTSAGRRSCASTCSCGWPSSARPTACARHPRGRGRVGATLPSDKAKYLVGFGLLAGRALHRHRRHPGRALRLGERVSPRASVTHDRHGRGRRARRSDLARPGNSDLDRLLLRAAGLLPDVLPLPASLLVPSSKHRRGAARTTTAMSKASRTKTSTKLAHSPVAGAQGARMNALIIFVLAAGC